MFAYRGNAASRYGQFRSELDGANTPSEVLDVLARQLPTQNALTAAILSPEDQQSKSNLPSYHIQHKAFWSEYVLLYRANVEPLSRVLRLSPHPLALSDVQRHTRLNMRTASFQHLLAAHGMNDAFAVPLIDRQLRFSMAVFAGNNLVLRPTDRFLMTRLAGDTAACLGATSTKQPHHLRLTERQMEIASWLIAGKSDWEIGEILRISPKTVNYHVENIKQTYGVRSRSQFIAAIVHEGGLRPE